MRKLILISAVVVTFLAACTSKKSEDAVSKAALEYYKYMINGDYDKYVEGMYNTDSIPSSYHEQLVTMIKQFVTQQKEEKGGMKSARVVSSAIDTLHSTANVFMEISYGDSTNEEIVVPMILKNGKWKMK